MAALRDVMERGAYILQRDLEQFEHSLANYLGVSHAYGVADGTNALILALRAADVGSGDEVIVPSHTYVASVAAIHYVGAQPCLVECGADHLIDIASARAAINRRTKAVMPVQLNGRTADMAQIQEFANEHQLLVIEDAAQALGSRYRGRFAGTHGLAGTFSFYPAKLLGCFGDGGAVVTDDDEMARRLGLLRDHGRNADGDVVTWGTNSRLDNLQAAILNVKFKTFQKDLERRRSIARRYESGLGEVDALRLPPGPDSDADRVDVYQNYEIEADERDSLKAYLEERGIRTIVQFGGRAVHQHDALGFEDVHLPRTEALYRRALLLPMNTSLSDEDVDHVIDCVRAFYGVGQR